MDIDVKPSDFGIDHFLEPEEINQLTVAEYREYERKLRNYRDWKNTIVSEKKLSWEEGYEIGKKVIKLAKILKKEGVAINIIAESTGLSEQEIAAL